MKKPPTHILYHDPRGKPTGTYKGWTVRIGKLWIEVYWRKCSKPTPQGG